MRTSQDSRVSGPAPSTDAAGPGDTLRTKVAAVAPCASARAVSCRVRKPRLPYVPAGAASGFNAVGNAARDAGKFGGRADIRGTPGPNGHMRQASTGSHNACPHGDVVARFTKRRQIVTATISTVPFRDATATQAAGSRRADDWNNMARHLPRTRRESCAVHAFPRP